MADLNIIAITIDGEPTDTLPEGNYELTSESYCTINGERVSNIELNYDSSTKAFSISPYTTNGTKCYLDFTEAEEKEYTLIINYEYAPGEEGDIRLGPYSATVPVGFSYYQSSPGIGNYIAVPEQVSGEMPDHDLTITVIYYKDLNGNKIPDSSE